MKNSAYILLGSNLGDRVLSIKNAIDQISLKAGKIIKSSAIYESNAWGFDSIIKFLNQAIEIQTEMPPQELLIELKKIENHLGRIREVDPGYTSRTIDLDILFYNDLVLSQEDLVIPHPRLHLRRFTLKPLAEIAGQKVHPLYKTSIDELIRNCPDTAEVSKYQPSYSLQDAKHEV